MMMSHARVWKAIKKEGVTECFWCELPFRNPGRPPTIDHVQPKSLGGHMAHGTVWSCGPCNSARGNIPFDVYLEAVLLERVMCKIEKREYRRPKRRKVNGEWIVTTMTRRQIRMVEANAAVVEISWIEPHDVAQDKRWERELT